MIVRILLLWITLLPWCSGQGKSDAEVNDAANGGEVISVDLRKMGGSQMLEVALDRDFITLNGKKTTLRTIYGDILPTAANFKVGKRLTEAFRLRHDVVISPSSPDVNAICAGGHYTPRTFSSSMFPRTQSWISPIEDTSTMIAETLIEFTKIELHGYPGLVHLLTGHARAGKSVALAKILYTLGMMGPSVWNIRVDLARMYPTTQPLHEMTLENMVEKFITPDFSDFFYNLLEVNPKKIIILFDGIEHLTDVQARKAVSIIASLTKKRVSVVLTGHAIIGKLLKHHRLLIDTYRIKEMTIRETETFLTNIWQAEIMNEIPAGPSTRTIKLEDINIRLKNYVQAFTHTLFKTTLPRQPVPLTILAEVFKRKSPLVVLPENIHYPVACFDYVFNPSAPSPALFIAIENAFLDKNGLYERIIEHLQGNLKDFNWEYGVASLATLIYNKEKLKNARNLLKYFDVEKAIQTLKDHEEVTILIDTIKYNGNPSIHFIYRELLEYYAVKFIISSINDNTAPISLLKHFLEDDRYFMTWEFLNCQVQKLPPSKLLSLSHDSLFQLMTTALQYQHENLFLYVYRDIADILISDHKLAEKSEVRAKVRNFLFSAKIMFNVDGKVLGMIKTMQEHPNPFQSQQMSHSILSPIQILARYGNLHTFETLQSTGVLFRSDINQYHDLCLDLLHIAVSRAAPNLGVLKFVMGHMAAHISDDDLNTLLYDTIHNTGDGCQPIANYLVRCGAQPNVKSNGQTLLHAAVQWNSPKLLRFVVEELKVLTIDTADDFGMTVFATALDANPSAQYTFPGWWEMIAYLVDHINPNRLSTVDFNYMTDFTSSISRKDFRSLEVSLMILNQGPIGLTVDPSNQIFLALRPLQLHEYSDVMISEYTRFVPFISWHHLASNIVSLRRILFLQTRHELGELNISPLEILVNYRGVHTLQAVQRKYYNRALKTLLRRERNSLTPADKTRIYTGLWNNVGDKEDFFDCLRLSNVLGPVTTYNEIYSFVKRYVGYWQLNIMRTPNIERWTVLTMLSQVRLNFLQGRFVNDGVAEMIVRLDQYMDELNQGGRSRALLFECLRRNRRRSAQLFQRNCFFSWNDVDQFNDAMIARHRDISEIRINSDNYLHMLAAIENTNTKKANQLVNFVRQLEKEPDITAIITGKSQMVVRDLLRHGSLAAYRQNQRYTDIINELYWHPLPNAKPRKFRLSSRTAALYAASAIPIIHGLYATLQTCLQQHNETGDHSCWYRSGTLALVTALGPVGTVLVKYTPWMVNHFSQIALDTLPHTAPRILRENIKLMQYFGLKYGVKTTVGALAAVGIGFDLYNIIEMSKMIDMCAQHGCISKDKIDYIISLTFSCVSIIVVGGMIMSGVGVIPGLLIGLGLMALEGFANGINDVVYYSSKYDTDFGENFRTFWHKVALQPPPADVQALARRTEWINSLYDGITQFLSESDENVVAYGLGIGHMTNNGVILAASGSIDMNNAKLENTRGLSRVIPTASENTTLLCLPHQDTTQVYDKYPNEVTSAEYRCENTFVIAHKRRWNTRTSDKSYMIYDLALVDSGKVFGSNTLNNLFLIYNGTITLNVIGGSGNITNIYMMQKDSFRGSIHLSQQSRKNILNLSGLQSPVLQFWWNVRYNMGKVRFGKIRNDFFSLYTLTNMFSNLQVIGRTNRPENFTCNHNRQQRRGILGFHESSITIDGGGGQSFANMDYVIDCKISVIRPFTHIIGSNFVNASYTTHIRLEYSIMKATTITGYSTIQPDESKFIVIFTNSPLFASTISVKYIPNSKTLMWNLQYSTSSSLLLSILRYHSPDPALQENTTEIEAVSCVFVDSYSESTIYPVINPPADGISTVIVRHFNVFVQVNSSRLVDVLSRYKGLTWHLKDTFFIVTKLTDPRTGQVFIFGSCINDRFYIDGNTTFLFGGSGSDVYVLSRQCSKHIWIQNEANDNALDTLVIPDTSCDLLWAATGSEDFSCCDSSWYDVTLFCSDRTNATSPHINVVLRNYLISSHYRHLQIYWHDAMYILLPTHWIQKYKDDNHTDETHYTDVKLALFFSFDQQWQTTTLTLTNSDTYVVFNGTDDVTTSLVAYRSQSNIILAKKYFNRESSSFVILQDFLLNDTDDIAVATKWQQWKLFSINAINDDATPTILTAGDILSLFFTTCFIDAARTEVDTDFTKEYFVDMTNDTNRNNTIVIEHNYRSMMNDETDQLGVLVVAGVTPGEFYADWDRRNGTSLSLCARQRCIIVRNWCSSIQHRLYRMEFIFTLNRRPIVIPHIDQLDCQEQANTSSDDQLLKQLNHKFSVAQKQLLLTVEIDDNDDARLKRCILSIIADNIANSSMYRLFGYASRIDHARFMLDNCHALFTREKLEKLSFATVNNTLQNAVQKYQLTSELTADEQKTVLLLLKNFGKLNNHCWDEFKSLLCNHENRTESNDNIVTFQTLNQVSHLFSRCVREF